jgi:YhcH/YjgK/YiaL family protein
MIFDTLDNYTRYAGLGNNLPAALKYLAETDFTLVEPGRVELGGGMYVLVQEYTTKPVSQGRWEAHKNYIDVQYLLSGRERLDFANIRTMRLKEYNPDKDFQVLTGIGHSLTLFPGSFVILHPEDAHIPGLVAGHPEAVKKVVVKVKI